MKKGIILLLGVGLAAAFAASAGAYVFPAGQQLHFEGTGVHTWNMRGGDSPHDRNTRALRIVNDAGEYVAAYSNRSLGLREDLADIHNLGFEFKESLHVGAGAPRISVELQNGDLLYLAAFYCNHPMAVTGDTWGRADFTRFLTNCTIWDNDGLSYAADGVNTAWEVYRLAHPDAVTERTYFVADEEGRYRIDRLSLGTGVAYTRGNLRGKLCTTEASC